MKSCFFFCSFFVLLLSFLAYELIIFTEYFKDLPLYKSEQCKTVFGVIGAEDIVNFKGIGLTGSDDRSKLWYSGDVLDIDNVPNGGIFAIYPTNNSDMVNIKKIELEGFPSEIAFHPHGIDLYKDLLYVINHAYGKGGERIEVFQIIDQKEKEISLKYKQSILMGENTYGKYNDLIVINEKDFIITNWLPIPHTAKGQHIKDTFWLDLKRLFTLIFLEKTFIEHCQIEGNHSICSTMTNTPARMHNGIAFDGKDLVLEARPVDKLVVLYRLKGKDLVYLAEFATDILVDNISYDEESKTFYLSGMLRFFDFLIEETAMAGGKKLEQHQEIKSGIDKIEVKENIKEMKIEKLVMLNDLTGSSIATKFQDYILMGTPFYDGISVCTV